MERKLAMVAGREVELERRICAGGCGRPFWVTPASPERRARGLCATVCKEGAQDVAFGGVAGHDVRERVKRAARRWRGTVLIPKYVQMLEFAIEALHEAAHQGIRISIKATLQDHGLAMGASDWGNCLNRARALAGDGNEEAKRLMSDFAAVNAAGGSGQKALPEKIKVPALREAAADEEEQAKEAAVVADVAVSGGDEGGFKRFVEKDAALPREHVAGPPPKAEIPILRSMAEQLFTPTPDPASIRPAVQEALLSSVAALAILTSTERRRVMAAVAAFFGEAP